MLKINIRKVLFILVCAEILIMYYSQLEVRESRRQVVYREQSGFHGKMQPSEHEKETLKEAS
ncbi:hypothetical protein LJK88_34265 [Paenibacillus sp. P26]|nr:hypothetical protein LJK88_34265 [Paenibacillus sp. P26]UUZ93842.1 hypothetical protein LJK87_03895 [Paenibacillus sp. P25]